MNIRSRKPRRSRFTKLAYTVIVSRPSGEADEFYYASVLAESVSHAEAAALDEVIEVDRRDWVNENGTGHGFENSGYSVVVVFAGHVEIIKWGWQS